MKRGRTYTGEAGKRVGSSRKKLQTEAARLRSGSRRRAASLRKMNVQTAGFLGIEKKYFDTFLLSSALAASTNGTGGNKDPATISTLSAPGTGDGPTNREGHKIVLKSVYVKGQVRWDAGAFTPNGESAYVALVLDTQSNAAQAASELVFVNNTANGLGATMPLRNVLYGNRFKILHAELLKVDYQAAFAGPVCAGSQKCFEFFSPLDLPVTFNAGTTEDIANVIDNSLHIIAYCNDVARAPKITYQSRVRFVG